MRIDLNALSLDELELLREEVSDRSGDVVDALGRGVDLEGQSLGELAGELRAIDDEIQKRRAQASGSAART